MLKLRDIRRAAILFAWFIAAGYSYAQTNSPGPTNVLTTARQVLDLALERARPGNIPVHIRGVLTHQDVFTPRWIFLQDQTAAILLRLNETNFPFVPGQLIEAEGVAEAGGILPIVHVSKYRVIGEGDMPRPKFIDAPHLVVGDDYANWSSIEGTVRDVAVTKGRLVLLCADGADHFQVWITHRQEMTLPLDLLDARVRLEGIPFLAIDDDGRASGFIFHQNGTNDITILKPGTSNIFIRPLAAIENLRGRVADRSSRVRTSGVVTFSSPDGWLAIQNGTEPLVAHLLKPIHPDEDTKGQFPKREFPPLKVGDQIELVGAPALTNSSVPDLQDVEYRIIGHAPVPAPEEVSIKSLASGKHDGELVTFQAQVVDAENHYVAHVIDVERHHDVDLYQDNVWLQTDGAILEGILETERAAPLPIARNEFVTVTGICRVEPGQPEQARPVKIYFRGAEDIVHRDPPPWWHSRRTVTILSITTAVALMTAAWITLLRRRVSQRTAQLREEAIERQKAEVHLVRFKAVIDATTDLVGISSLDGKTIYINEAGRKMLQVPDDVDVTGLPMSRFYPEDVNRFFTKVAIPQAMRDGFWAGELRLRGWHGQEIPVSFVGSAVKGDDGKPLHLSCIARDISERKKIEDQLRWALAEEKELNRLKSNFISMVTHEIRTPLALILSSSEILSRYLERLLPEKRAGHLRNIDAAVLRMSALMEDVLLFSKAEAGRMEFNPITMDLRHFCGQIVEEIASATNHKCPVELSVAPFHESARGDEHLLRHIIANLLGNAIKYSRAGSAVKLSVTLEDGDAHFVVKDRGMGISQEDLRRLFTPFYRGKNAAPQQGTGLGLVIVKHCVERHGGVIEIESIQNAGTTVSVRLPLFSPNHTEFIKRISKQETT